MNVRRINTILWLATVGLSALAAVSLVIGLVLPLQASPDNQTSSVQERAAQKTLAATMQALPGFERIASRALRAPLTEVPAAAASGGNGSMMSQQNDSAPVLVGTIGDSLAMFRMPDGSIALKGIGDEIGGADVLAIRPAQVDLLSNGKRITLEKPKPPASPGDGSIETGPMP